MGDAPRFHSNFTDKPSFFGDLSVNFCPLYWGFTDKRLFLTIFIGVSVIGSDFAKCSAARQLLNHCT
jgi:hypothetical protein